MNDITYAVSVDVNNPIIPYNVYIASVLDSSVRYLEITLYQNGNVITLSNTATATASLVTDDVLIDDSVECTISNNIITVPLGNLQRHGNLDVQVTVTEGTKVLAIPFPIQVRVTPNIAEEAQIDDDSLGSYAEVVREIAAARGGYSDLKGRIEAASLESDVLSWLDNYYTKAQMDSKWWDKVVIPDTDSEYFPGRFVTPEMYGAKADGITDDSEAIQLAINGGNRKVVLMVGNYATDSTIVIEGQRDVIQVGTITYRGNGSAVKIQKVTTHCNLKFDKILAESGNGIEIYASSYSINNKQYVQYVKLEFDIIKANDKCIYLNLDVESGLDSADIGWINEIIISNGHFAKGNYGIYGDAKGYSRMNNIKLYNVSIEGIKNNAGTAVGIYMANGCKRWSFVNLRYADNEFDKLMTTVGVVEEFLFYGPQWARNSLWTLSNETTGIINIPVHGEFSAGTISGMTRIVNGGVIGNTPNYEIDGLNTIVTGLGSVTDRFVFKSITYNSSNKKTLKEHGIVPAEAGFYFITLTTNTKGDHSSVYIVRVWNVAGDGETPNYDVDVAIPIYAGTGSQAPRITVAVGENDDPKIYGLLSKNTSISTTNIQTMAIKVANL